GGLARNRVHRIVRIARAEREYLERVPRVDLLRGAEPRLAPPRVDRRFALARRRRAIGERRAHRIRYALGKELADEHAAVTRDDGGERMRQYRAGVREQTAPVAGVMRAVAKLDAKIHVQRS